MRLIQSAASQAGSQDDKLRQQPWIAAEALGDRPVSVTNLAAIPEKRAGFDRISLRRLVLIRWVAIAGQAGALLVVHYAFDFHLPLLPAFAVVGCSVVLNLFITLYRRAPTRLGGREAALFLGYDLL